MEVFYQIKWILKLWRVVVFVRHEDDHLDVGMERRLAQVVRSDGQVEPAAVDGPVHRHQLEVDGSTRSNFAADGIDREVAAVVTVDDSVTNLF